MKFSRTEQAKGNFLIQVTALAGFTVDGVFQNKENLFPCEKSIFQ
jgi:hypothetical protein